MFFYLSKILAFLAQPLAVVFILLLVSRIVRPAHWRKRLLIAGISLLVFTSNYFIANEVMRAWETPVTPLTSLGRYDYAIILTGVTRTEMKPKDRVYFTQGADRATHTLQLYKMGFVKKIIVSGGSGRLDGRGVKEADDLADFLVLAGVPKEDILIENESKNTRESAVAVAKLLSTVEGSKTLLLVTSGYHMRRALACFKKVDLAVEPFAVQPVSDERHFGLGLILIPRVDAIGMWQTMIREWVGIIVYWLAGYI